MSHQIYPRKDGLSVDTNPRNTLMSSSGIIVAVNDEPRTPLPGATQQVPANAGLPFDEEAKLVYGVVLSLRNMVKKISGK